MQATCCFWVLFISLIHSVQCGGINCGGSLICPGVTFANDANTLLMQGLRDGIYKADLPDDTTYQNGDHVICVSESIPINLGPLFASVVGNLGSGGICVFPQNLQSNLTLGTIKQLADKLLEHGCKTCGSVPTDFLDGGVDGANDNSQGELTFNYVGDPYCTGTCISGANENDSGSSSIAQAQSETTSTSSTSTTAAPTATQTSVVVVVVTTSTASGPNNPTSSASASISSQTSDQTSAATTLALRAASRVDTMSGPLIGIVWVAGWALLRVL